MKSKIELLDSSLTLRIPSKLATIYNLNFDDEVNLVMNVNGIKIEKVENTKTLEDLLSASPKGSLRLSQEDKEWLNF